MNNIDKGNFFIFYYLLTDCFFVYVYDAELHANLYTFYSLLCSYDILHIIWLDFYDVSDYGEIILFN